MKDAPDLPSSPQVPAQLAGPRESITQFVDEVCRDLGVSKARLSEVGTVDELVAAATDTHKTLIEHGQTMAQFVQIVQNWRQVSL
jgi:hypothetical protein